MTATNKFIYNDNDLFETFRQFENIIKESDDKEFIYSLLDRMRKGLYMESESENNTIYDDETILSYFHILEQLTTKYDENQKLELKVNINEFTHSILKDTFLYESNRLEVESKTKQN